MNKLTPVLIGHAVFVIYLMSCNITDTNAYADVPQTKPATTAQPTPPKTPPPQVSESSPDTPNEATATPNQLVLPGGIVMTPQPNVTQQVLMYSYVPGENPDKSCAALGKRVTKQGGSVLWNDTTNGGAGCATDLFWSGHCVYYRAAGIDERKLASVYVSLRPSPKGAKDCR